MKKQIRKLIQDFQNALIDLSFSIYKSPTERVRLEEKLSTAKTQLIIAIEDMEEELNKMKFMEKNQTNKSRTVLMRGPKPSNPNDVSTWTEDQRMAAGSWSKHEIQHRTDHLCEPYNWVPGWSGNLSPDEIQNQLKAYWKI